MLYVYKLSRIKIVSLRKWQNFEFIFELDLSVELQNSCRISTRMYRIWQLWRMSVESVPVVYILQVVPRSTQLLNLYQQPTYRQVWYMSTVTEHWHHHSTPTSSPIGYNWLHHHWNTPSSLKRHSIERYWLNNLDVPALDLTDMRVCVCVGLLGTSPLTGMHSNSPSSSLLLDQRWRDTFPKTYAFHFLELI